MTKTDPTIADVMDALRQLYERLGRVEQLLRQSPVKGTPERPAPINVTIPASPSPAAPPQRGPHTPAPAGGRPPAKQATEKQVRFLRVLAQSRGMDGPGLLDYVRQVAGWAPDSLEDLGKLSSYKASQVINALQKLPEPAKGAAAIEGAIAAHRATHDEDVPF